MAIDITQLPGMGGQTGSIVVNAVQTIENGVLCVAEASLFNCFEAILSAAELIWDSFQALFPSRPKVGKDSASDDTALFFISSPNPVIALWGIGIRDLESQGIPTSASGGAGQAANLALGQAVLADLQRQFDGPIAPKLTFGGQPATGQALFDLYRQLGFTANHPDSNQTAIDQRAQLDQLYTNSVNLGYINPLTGFPGPPPTTTNPPPKKAPCPPFTALPDCLPQPPAIDPNNDEVEQGYASLGYWFQILAIYVMNLFEKAPGTTTTVGNGNADPVTCGQLSALMSRLTNAVQQVAANISEKAPADQALLQTLVDEFYQLNEILAGTEVLVNPRIPPLPPIVPPPPYTLLDAKRDGDAAVQILFEQTVPFGQ